MMIASETPPRILTVHDYSPCPAGYFGNIPAGLLYRRPPGGVFRNYLEIGGRLWSHGRTNLPQDQWHGKARTISNPKDRESIQSIYQISML
jgi:hypothetical protein